MTDMTLAVYGTLDDEGGFVPGKGLAYRREVENLLGKTMYAILNDAARYRSQQGWGRSEGTHVVFVRVASIRDLPESYEQYKAHNIVGGT